MWLGAALTLLAPAMLQSQQQAGMRPLAIPTGHGILMQCRAVPSDSIRPKRPGSIAREYELTHTADISERRVGVTYDSAGRPAALVEMAALAHPTASEVYSFVVRFRPPGVVQGFAYRLDTTTSQRPTPIFGPELPGPSNLGRRGLSLQEKAAALALAEWLWPRRCAQQGKSE